MFEDFIQNYTYEMSGSPSPTFKTKADFVEFMSKHVELEEMYRTFNMGVGMVLVVSSENVDSILANTDGYVIGHIADGAKCVEFI